MAQQKKRGRPKGKKNSRKPKLQQEMEAMPQHSQQGEIIEPNPSLSQKVKSLFASSTQSSNRILPAAEKEPREPRENHSETTSRINSDFEATATRLEEKYAPGGSEEPAPEVKIPEPEVIPKIITDATVEKFLRFFFEGMVRVHGQHWQMSELDYSVMIPVNTAMVNEQVSKFKWLMNSENKALIVWCLVMGVLVMSRSTAGGKLIEWLMEKLVSLGSKTESPINKGSPESPAS